MRPRLCLLILCLLISPRTHAQARESALSDAEIETLRDTAAYPPERIKAFIAFLDGRTKILEALANGPRRPGREDDIHDLMEQVASIADDLEDNLDDYAPRHRDLRKVLPKLLAATEHWTTILRTPPEHSTYSVARKLSLAAIHDIHDDAAKMVDEQRTWFAAHPPDKQTPPGER